MIEIQYKSGEDERFTGADLAGQWEAITDDLTGIQYAAHKIPNRKGDGLKVRGIYGELRDDHASRMEREAVADRERQQRDLDALIAVRDWTYNGHNPNHL